MTGKPDALDPLLALASNADPSRFERRSLLGEGGMGTVHLAFDRLMLREVALKTLRQDLTASEDRERHFIQEAQLTGRLDHPNIAPAHDLSTAGEGAPATLIMKYVAGEPYSALIERFHASPTDARLREALQVFVKVCDAISFAHERGVIHCDLKPENVMVGKHGQVYVMDWGVAVYRAPNWPSMPEAGPAAADGLQGLDDSGLFGSLAYMAPEQLRGERDAIDATTDVYGLGGLLCVLITGKPPRQGVADIADWQAASNVEERRATLGMPPELCRIADRALSPDREDRFQTVEELKSEIETFLTGGGWFGTRRYLAGDVILREGESGSEAFIIASGSCDVFQGEADGEQRFIRTLGPGETFGELSVITGEPRSATVIAQTDITLRVVTEEALDRELQGNPVLAAFMSAVTTRFRELEKKR
ncbi:MAG: serine/threonine-protein kinase [Polyangiales bacterium]